mgnify:FL=1
MGHVSKKHILEFAKALSNQVNTSVTSNRRDIANYVIHSESFDSAASEVLDNDVKRIEQMVEDNIVKTLGVNSESYTDAQVNAAKFISAIALNRGAGIAGLKELKPSSASKNVYDAFEIGIEDAIDPSTITVNAEAYDGQKLDNSFLFSVAFNFTASRQDEFGEAFFPTIVIDPTVSDIEMEIQFTSILKEVERTPDGSTSREKFGKVALIKAIYDSEVFGVDKNRAVVVFRNEYKDKLVEEEKHNEEITGEVIETAPVKFGVELDYIAVCQTDKLLARGIGDNTDSLDRTIILDKVYFSLDTENFVVTTSQMAGSNFVPNPQDHNKDAILNFNHGQIVINTTNTKTSKGNESTVLKALPADHTITLSVAINGYANTQLGDIVLYANKPAGGIKVVSIRNAAGQLLDKTEADYKTIETAIEKFEYLGYELIAYTTNSNLRKRELQISLETQKQRFPVPVRSGIMGMLPINNDTGTDNDITVVTGHAQALGARISVTAVDTLIKHADNMRYITNNGTVVPEKQITEAGFKGVGKFLLDPYYMHQTIDLLEVVDSLESATRDVAIQQSLIQQLFTAAVDMYIDSYYGVAFENAMNNSSAARPTLIVGTDPNVYRLLVKGQDTFQLGDMFDIKVVKTFNRKIEGKIYAAFGIFDDQRNSVPNPLNFGTCAYAPTIVYDVVRDINGATSREVRNNPRFAHFINTPLIAEFDVLNITQAFHKLNLRILKS